MASPDATHALVRLGEGPAPDAPVSDPGTPFRRLRRWLVALVFVVPVVTSLLYNFAIATPRYASEIAFVVRSSQKPHDRLSIISLGQGGAISTSDDSEAVLAYLKSRDILDQVNRDGLVARIFARPALDPIAAFPSLLAGNSREDFHRHFQNYVRADFDRATDIIHVQVQSFTAAEAREIARRLLDASERMVNRLNQRAQANIVNGAERDMADATNQVNRVLDRMNAVRSRNRIIDPGLDAGASIKLQSGTATELAQVEVRLNEIRRSAPQSPLIGQLQARRRALRSQLNRQVGATAGSNGSLANRLNDYEALVARREIAEKQLMAASFQLVSARDSASRQQLYLEQIARPSLPDEARYPRGWLNLLLTVLICGGLLWITLSLAELVFDDE